MAGYYVQNFGCRATQADGAALERQFEERGLDRAPAPQQAEIVVLNTCTVTASADQDARAAIRRLHRENPNCQIVVTGCYAQRAPQEVAALPGVSRVVGNSHKHRLAELAGVKSRTSDFGLHTSDLDPPTLDLGLRTSDFGLADSGVGLRASHTAAADSRHEKSFVPLTALVANAGGGGLAEGRGPRADVGGPTSDVRVFISDIFAHTELLAAPVFDAANERTRPNLKVQDGCDNRCSFCVIPFVRGQSRSLPLSDVIREAGALVAAGYRELVISGINLGRWGRDLASGSQLSAFSHGLLRPTPFESLVRAILAETSIEKLRISSVEPMDWTDSLIGLVAGTPRIAKHAHVPMQSGSDRVLRLMHRKYRPWHYREKIQKIREAMPAAAIGADVMTGFPGENDADFEATRKMIEDLPFTYLHVFTYSARPGTPAASMPQQVPVQVARERNRVLRDLAAQKKQAFMRSFVGQTLEAITLNVQEGNSTEALTDNYLKMRLAGKRDSNRWVQAQVAGMDGETLVGS